MNLFDIFLRGTYLKIEQMYTYCYKNAAEIQYLDNQKQANKNDKIKLL